MGAQFGDIFFDSLSRWLRWLGILVIVECFDRFPSYKELQDFFIEKKKK